MEASAPHLDDMCCLNKEERAGLPGARSLDRRHQFYVPHGHAVLNESTASKMDQGHSQSENN
jgi:hypothetical protein